MTTERPMPGAAAPALELETTAGAWSLADRSPENFVMVVFYRGLHCPVCKGFLGDLERLLPEFAEAGTEVIAVSMDSAERAAQSARDWGLTGLRLGYGLTEAQARAWGLYLSEAIKEAEIPLFCEPGLFLIDRAGRLYMVNVSSMPFARPDVASLPGRLKFAVENSYPARGTRA